MAETIIGWIVGLAVLAGLAYFLWWVFARLYFVRATADKAFVRTGGGKPKVVIGGGCFVLPWWHNITWVSLASTRIRVVKANRAALISKDRFRVDVGADFYVRTPAEEESVLRAAQSLGPRSTNPEALTELLEDELTAALRSVAARRTLMELHEDRIGFAKEVADQVRDSLALKGLMLESVSLFALDQTDAEQYDPSNVFDAVGLEQIAALTSRARVLRNEHERNAEVAVKEKDVQTHKTLLTLEQERAMAEHAQRRAIETDQARQRAETERFRFTQEELVRLQEIEKERRVREAEIERDRLIREKNLREQINLIEAEREAELAQIEKEKLVRISEQEKERAINAARRLTSVELSEHEMMVFQKQAARLLAEAEVKKAEQLVETAHQKAAVERERELALIRAETEWQVAQKKAEATERLAQATRTEGEARAYAQRQMVEAESAIADKLVWKDVLSQLIQQAPAIAKELMTPAEKIESIRVLDVRGLGGGPESSNGSTVERILSAVVSSGALLPVIREILTFAKVEPAKILSLLSDKGTEKSDK
ncbi:MAG: SPFH domain-containing protein [Armatimonadetes bacterium]|nr:SPFH domain-containing protein [Armatimonadota bacterium]MDW8120885.1 flotillin domain-containing protein [Armatimonadota bacterium]